MTMLMCECEGSLFKMLKMMSIDIVGIQDKFVITEADFVALGDWMKEEICILCTI